MGLRKQKNFNKLVLSNPVRFIISVLIIISARKQDKSLTLNVDQNTPMSRKLSILFISIVFVSISYSEFYL